MPLTVLQCEYAKPQFKAFKLFDAEGLYLLVKPSGKKYWRYKYRFNDKEKTLSIGDYRAFTLSEARQEREKAQRQLARGQDPVMVMATEKRLAVYKSNQTLELVAREWFERNKHKWKPKHATCILFRLETMLFIDLGHYPVSDITPQLLLGCLQKIELRSADIARRLLQYVNNIFEYAIVTGRLHHNCTTSLKQVMEKPKNGHYASIEIDELPNLVKAILSDKSGYTQTRLAMQMMLHTFVRTNELIAAKWSEFNDDFTMWIIKGERMKMGVDHMVPISPQVKAILLRLHAINGRWEYVFPSVSNPRNHMSENCLLMCLKRIKYQYKMTVHGFRALAMGVIRERLEYEFDVVDRQLSHVPVGEVNRAYDRAKFLSKRIQMMSDYSNYLNALATNRPFERKSDGQQFDKPVRSFTYQAYDGHYQTRIGYRATGFGQKGEARIMAEASQRPWQQSQILVETRYTTTLRSNS